MKKLLFNTFKLIIVSFFLFSCNGNDKDIPMLNVSKTEILFSNSGGNEVVKIDTNQRNFMAKSTENWIHVEKSDTSITVSADANLNATNREGKVIVTSGGMAKEINIKQSEAGLSVITNKSEFNIPSAEGNFNFTFSINEEKYLIACGENWIKLNINKPEKTVNFSVEENNSTEARNGKIKFLVAGEIVKEIVVHQEGVKVNFTLPFTKFGSTAEQVKLFEEKRNNKKLRETDISSTGTQLAYQLNDKVFDEVNYLVNLKGLAQCSLFVKGGTISDQDKELFESYLLSNGFEQKTQKGFETTISNEKVDKPVFINMETQTKVEFMGDIKHNHYRFTYFPIQLKAYPTINALPFFKKEITKEQVLEYENAHNGTLNDDKSTLNYGKEGAKKDQLFFDVSGDEILGRTYWVYYEGQEKHGLKQVSVYYANPNIAFYQGLDGDYYLTDEFMNLAKKEGYKYLGYSAKYGNHIFSNDDKDLTLSVKWYKSDSLGWNLRVSIY